MITIREEVRGVKVGSQIGRWTVLGPAFSRGHKRWGFVARCACGRIYVVADNHLSGGRTEQCVFCSNHDRNLRHGGARSGGRDRLYSVWGGMVGRCTNPNNKKYPRYGGRGIEVCAEWMDYALFRAWAMANGHRANLELDRIDNDKGYEPGNCQWLTKSENSKKRRAEERAAGINHGKRIWAKRSLDRSRVR